MVWSLPPAQELASRVLVAGLLAGVGLSGHVAPLELLLSGLCLGYSLLLLPWAFPQHPHLPSSCSTPGELIRPLAQHPAFQAYMAFFTLIGLVLPLAFTVAGHALGDSAALAHGCSYLFPLLTQVLAEKLLATMSFCSLPGFFMLASVFVTCRVFRTWSWFQEAHRIHGWQPSHIPTWANFHTALPGLLFFMWTYNILFMLIPVCLPYAFKVHYNWGNPAKTKAI